MSTMAQAFVCVEGLRLGNIARPGDSPVIQRHRRACVAGAAVKLRREKRRQDGVRRRLQCRKYVYTAAATSS